MKRRTLRDFHNELSWNTKIYTLLAISVLLLARFTSALTTDFAITIVLGLLIILFVESFAIISFNNPGAWVYIKWMVILFVLALVLLGWARLLYHAKNCPVKFACFSFHYRYVTGNTLQRIGVGV